MITPLMTTLLVTSLTPAVSPAPRAVAPPPTRLVGVLTEQFSRRCLPGGREEWHDPRFEVGFVPLVPGSVKIPRGLLNQVVIVTGHLKENVVPQARSSQVNCPIYQMRSDMVVAKGGMRVRRGPAVAAGTGFVVQSIVVLRDFTVRRVGDKLKVRLRLPAGLGLGAPRLEMRYEGCFGKPGTLGKGEGSSRWKAGEWMEAEFPVFETEASNENRKGAPAGVHRYVAHSLGLRAGTAAGVYLDLDYELGRHGGLKLACPR